MAIDFKWDYAGAGEILRWAETIAVLEQEAISRCPPDCTVDTYVGSVRANARITTASEEAYQDNLENNTLLKAIGQ